MLEVLQMTALRGRLVLFVKNALQMKRARELDMGKNGCQSQTPKPAIAVFSLPLKWAPVGKLLSQLLGKGFASFP